MSLRKIKWRLLGLFAGKKVLQAFFEKIHYWSLFGMNIGGFAGDVKESGEKNVWSHLKKQSPGAKPIVFDVGANQGSWSRGIYEYFKGKITLHAFEPSLASFAILKKTLPPDITSYYIGFSDFPGTQTLFSDTAGSGLSSLSKRNLVHFGKSFNEEEEVALTTLDRFCEENKIHHIDLLKLDTEGHELNILKGAADLLSKNAIGMIQFEFGGANIDSRTYFQDFWYLLSPQYNICRIIRNGLQLIPSYQETCEVFLTTNFLAVSKKL